MGYFPNGTAGERYQAQYCNRCLHGHGEQSECAVWLAQMMYNYDECDKNDSVLDVLIPRSKDRLSNEQCAMFVETP